MPGARLRMFGSAPPGQEDYLERCKKLAAELGISELASFEGRVDNIRDAYAAGDVVVLCSITEGFPYTLIEAMTCGRVCVATDVGGVTEALADTGLVVPPRSPQSLAEACLAACCRTTTGAGAWVPQPGSAPCSSLPSPVRSALTRRYTNPSDPAACLSAPRLSAMSQQTRTAGGGRMTTGIVLDPPSPPAPAVAEADTQPFPVLVAPKQSRARGRMITGIVQDEPSAPAPAVAHADPQQCAVRVVPKKSGHRVAAATALAGAGQAGGGGC